MTVVASSFGQGVLDRDKFTELLELDGGSKEDSFLIELVPLFLDDMDQFMERAAAWLDRLPAAV